jgi:hypothetical protein
MNSEFACPRCGGKTVYCKQDELAFTSDYWSLPFLKRRVHALEACVWIIRDLRDANSTRRCLLCPSTFTLLNDDEIYAVVFPHSLGQYGGHVKMLATGLSVRMANEHGANRQYLHFPFPLPWNVSEERLQTLLTFQ